MARCAASPESSAIVSRSWRMMPTTDRSGRGGTPVTLSTRPILWPDESSHSNDRARPGMSSSESTSPHQTLSSAAEVTGAGGRKT
jgi:hypothetical protein